MPPDPALIVGVHYVRIGLARAAAAVNQWWTLHEDREPLEDSSPLRAELFSADQMAQHGLGLAAAHRVGRSQGPDRLLQRLDENERLLLDTVRSLGVASAQKIRLVPAAAWLLDNGHLIREQILIARRHLPKGYSRELSRLEVHLDQGASAGFPRVYDLALEAIAHGDGRIDPDSLRRFVTAYQTLAPLTLGELWAVPIMLRLALIENLRRVGGRVIANGRHRDHAQAWSDRMLHAAENTPRDLILVIADMARSDPPLVSAFVAELARCLQGRGPALALPLTWIEQRLAESSLTIAQLVHEENQQQAADQVTISNSIGSLRLLGATDWHDFVEAVSRVEQTLREDSALPRSVHRDMDFATRDRYRHVVAELARHSDCAEHDVAAAAVALAHHAAMTDGSDAARAHVGYYLIDHGRVELERAVAYRPALMQRIGRTLQRKPLALHIGAIMGLTVLIAAAFLAWVDADGTAGTLRTLLILVTLIAASQLASSLVNWLSTLLVAPQRLPRMDYAFGIPELQRTLVVVPSMLGSTQAVEELIEALEVRFLGNRDSKVHFALLSDFCDADHEVTETDAALLAQAAFGIATLNQKYGNGSADRFLLLHRPRRWNAVDRRWMGHERKRGKLADLNAALRSGNFERFSTVVGALGPGAKIRYVVTLDSDTGLPRDSVRQLVAAMAHPLNVPRYDATCTKVCSGYGILQPRVTTSLSGAERSRYSLMHSDESGIDPYTRSASDVYQDCFGEGSFIGKGIYDVEAFEFALHGRFPDNRILSHDLLEGCHARSGLISDVSLFEDYPARFSADMSRRERWIRGDWQIAAWLLPHVPGPNGSSRSNPLSLLSRWKIFDNLRRSLVAPALMAMLLIGWIALPVSAGASLAVIGLLVVQPVMAGLVNLFRKMNESRSARHGATVLRATLRGLVQAGFRLSCLPYEALCNLRAIGITLYRMWFTRRGLLEWGVVLRGGARGRDLTMLGAFRVMWIAPLLGIAAAAIISIQSQYLELVRAAPILLLWLFAPALVHWMSRPLHARDETLDADQRVHLRRLARRTWAFFERFVGAEDRWLPPDNFQETPLPVIAHRTSPTNIGLALLATLAARDFGFISSRGLIERTRSTFDTLRLLPRHRGHFFNWYDTRTLLPLAPRYVSTVDSGNLAAHLLTLRAGLNSLPNQPVAGPCLFAGLADTLAQIEERASGELLGIVADAKALLHEATLDAAPDLPRMLYLLDGVATGALGMADTQADHPGPAAEWIEALVRQSCDARDELRQFAPWLQLRSAPDGLESFVAFGESPTLADLAHRSEPRLARLDVELMRSGPAHPRAWLSELRALLLLARDRARARIVEVESLVEQAEAFATMEYEFLYDRSRHLLAIGYNVDESRRDPGCYDMLASEARLCSFVAIAQGQLPQDNWWALGRRLTCAGGNPVLLSWSGSMFEYLMPELVMPSYEGSLIAQSCREAVAQQITYGDARGLPWGVSESGYSAMDADANYQYHAFGVPSLGLKRGLGADRVVAPYASVLALMVAPRAAFANLQRLSAAGMDGAYGYYEAIDYSPARTPRGRTSVVLQSFMAHHQGMSMLALAHVLLKKPMQRRFESMPLFRATLPLLQERVPKTTEFHLPDGGAGEDTVLEDAGASQTGLPLSADTPTPEVQLMSNGRYHVMVTNAGGGYSRWNDLAVTRWREDATRDHWGTFLYLRDVDSGAFWSAAHQPTLRRADSYEATFSEGRAEFRRRDHDIEAYSEIVVSPEDDIELRRLRITNHAATRRVIEITSYAEVVLGIPAADAAQTAFGNLFVQTEIVAARRAILCNRRARSIGEASPWMLHLMASNGASVSDVSYETDRLRFIGRGRSLADPAAMNLDAALSGSAGAVLDPMVAIRCKVSLGPGESTTLDWILGAADSREACMALLGKYQDRHLADRVFDLAWTHAGVTLRQINASEADAQLYRRLAGAVLFAGPALRADAALLVQNRRGQSGLWAYAISGDLPIVLLKMSQLDRIDLARQLIQCHAYWRLKGLAVDLVIWNEDHASYRQLLQDRILALIAQGVAANAIDRPGGIFMRRSEQIADEDRVLLQSVARILIADDQGSLAEQLDRRVVGSRSAIARLRPTRAHRMVAVPRSPKSVPPLLLGNPLGGFSENGSEYVIATTRTQKTPMPWVNVIANPGFGTVVSESASGYTWSENAHEFRLTPWSDDGVGSAVGEAIYLRDEESGQFWSPTPFPCPGDAPYLTRHGFGYSVFENRESGIESELSVYVDIEASVKFSVLKLRNVSGQARRLSATGYVEWVLGDLRANSAMHVVTEIDSASGALFARNAYSAEFADRVAFLDVDDSSRTLTGDRSEFLGRNGSLENPRAMRRTQLSGRVGAGLDCCGAIQVTFDLLDGEQREVIFRLGAGRNGEQARTLATRMRRTGAARAALEQVKRHWQQVLGAVQVRTPDPALDVLVNGWLLYQTMACRLWARSGYYQSGGAFGFRDQLQDVMAIVHAAPELTRDHLLRCAAQQYPQGDVQHWWHPPVGRGVRTRCSDDYLWLPLAACRYVACTGDMQVLDEMQPFLEGRTLGEHEESHYGLPGISAEQASLYEHCVRAIEHALRWGEHGLPLMGSGDWNDGMNLVGIEGKGESVWLGFFLYEVLVSFAGVADARGDSTFSERCRAQALALQQNLERHGWDGAWYRRAWFDDGSPLGSSVNAECSIDSIAQSWSVLSGAADPARARLAMDALDRRLVRDEDRLVCLLDPPFDKAGMNPGYIGGYVPGVRENGGQYTHAAIWAAMAFARIGEVERAWKVLALINPIEHSRDAQAVQRYKTEPYVVAADVYAVPPHTGRGGWTWYTGSAAWLYRLILESLLGVQREGTRLRLAPKLPSGWTSFDLQYRYKDTTYRIAVQQLPADRHAMRLVIDGVEQSDPVIELADDGAAHAVELTLGRAPHPA